MNPINPKRQVTLNSPLAPAAAAAALEARIRPSLLVSLTRDPERVFRGAVEGDSFRVSFIPWGRNSWMPVCQGTIQPTGTGSRIEVGMALSPLVLAFDLIWLAAASAGTLFVLHGTVKQELPPVTLTILLMIPIFLVGSVGGWTYGARQTEAALKETFRA